MGRGTPEESGQCGILRNKVSSQGPREGESWSQSLGVWIQGRGGQLGCREGEFRATRTMEYKKKKTSVILLKHPFLFFLCPGMAGVM